MSSISPINRNYDNENISRKLQRSYQENFILISQIQSLKSQLKNKVSPSKNNNEILKQNDSLNKTNAMIKGLIASNLKSGIMSCFWCFKTQSIKILSQSFNKWKNKSMIIALHQHYLDSNTSPCNKIISEHSVQDKLLAITKVAEDTVYRSKKNIETYNTIEKDRKIHLLLSAAHDIMKDNKVSSISDLDINVNLYNNFKNSSNSNSNRSQSPVKSLPNSRSNNRDKSSINNINKIQSKYQQQQKERRESHQKKYLNSEDTRGRSRERNNNSINRNIVDNKNNNNNKIRSKIDVNKRIANIVEKENLPSYLAPTCASRKKSVSPDKIKNVIYDNNIISLSNIKHTESNRKNTIYINDSESTYVDVDVIKEESPIIYNIPIKDNKIKISAPGVFYFESFIKKDQQNQSPIQISNNKVGINEDILISKEKDDRNNDISDKYLTSVDSVDTFSGDLYKNNHALSFDQFNSKSTSISSRSLRSSRSVSPLTPYQNSLFSPDLKNRNIPATQTRAIQEMDSKQYNLIYGNLEENKIAWQDDLRK